MGIIDPTPVVVVVEVLTVITVFAIITGNLERLLRLNPLHRYPVNFRA